MSEQDVALCRRKWLNLSKSICQILARRESLYQGLCDAIPLEPDERDDLLEKVARESKEITKLCGKTRDIELACPVPVGIKAAFGKTVIPDHIRCALIVMVMSRLSEDLASDTKRVCSLVSLCAGRDPETALEVRDAFQFGGLLRKVSMVKLSNSKVVDCHEAMLRESALNRILGNEPTSETLALEESQAWDGRRGR